MVDSNLIRQIKEHQNFVAEYLRGLYIDPYLKGELNKFDLTPKQVFDSDKIIWQFWGQGIDENTPDIVKASFASVEKYKGDYERIILTENIVKDFLDLPDFVYEKLHKCFNYTFFSDLLRISLLSVYGGVWIDATILLTDYIPSEILNSEFFAFQRGRRSDNFDVLETQYPYYWGVG